MAKNKGYSGKKSNQAEKIVIVVLALVFIVLFISVTSRVDKLETTATVGSVQFEIGGLDAEGNEIKNTGCIRMKKARNVDGLEVVLAEDADVKYAIYFYGINEDDEEVFLSASDVLDVDFDASIIPEGAELFRVVIEPTLDAEVSIFEIAGYAEQLTITYNK